MRILLFSLLLCFCFQQASFAQGIVTLKDKEFVYNTPVDSVIWNRLSASSLFKSMQPMQQELYYWVNVFRKNPGSFFKNEVSSFLRQFPEANTEEAKSLELDLALLKALPFIMPESGLITMSQTQATDLAKRGGVISHFSATGKGFQKRFSEAGFYRCGAENIYFGSPNALEALIILLLDHRVADKGHRVNLMDARFTFMGASFAPVSQKKVVLVQDFAGM